MNTTQKTIIGDHWHARYLAEESWLLTRVESDPIDPFRQWDQLVRPESAAGSDLRAALSALCGQGDPNVVSFYLKRCAEIVERALREEKHLSPPSIGSFPHNRSRLYRYGNYARALSGGPISVEELRQAVLDIEEWCKESPPVRAWDSQGQAYLLDAVRVSLIIGDCQRSAAILGRKRSWKWHPQEHSVLGKISVATECTGLPLSLLREFDAYFDVIRDPDFKQDRYMELDNLRIELAAIRDKYFISADGTIDWQRAISSISS